MNEALILIGGTIATLLPIANPFSTAPVFATITQGYTDVERKKQARMAIIYMIGVLLVTLFVGALVLKFFGVGIPGVAHRRGVANRSGRFFDGQSGTTGTRVRGE